LDEPISSLDPLGGEMVSRFLQSLIRKREHTFVIVEQRIEEFIPWVDRIVAMQEGRIVADGPPFDVLNDEARWEHVRPAGVNVPPGEMIAIVGQNGSGKTTRLKHVNGLLRPTRGRVLVEGIDTSASAPSALSRLDGLVFQHPDRQLFKLGVKDEVELGMKRLGLEPQERARRVADILKLVGLEHAATSASFGLSLGERKRLALAAALSADPKIILVDEPTTGQDLTMKIEIMDLLQTLNGT